MRFGRARLEYLTPAGRLERLEGLLPLADGRIRLEPFAAPPAAASPSPEAGLSAAGVTGVGARDRAAKAGIRATFTEAGIRVTKAEPGLRLVRLLLELQDVNLRDRFLANGLQSWSETRLLGPDDRLGGLRLLGFLRPYGDYGWVDYPGRPGSFHSHWLTYTVNSSHSGRSAGTGGGVTFLGSLNEATAYTVFRADYRAGAAGGGAGPGPSGRAPAIGGSCWAEVDVEGMEPGPGEVLAHIFWAEADAPPASPGNREGSGEGSPLSPPLPETESPLLPLVRMYAARLAEVLKEGPEADRVGFGPGRLVPHLDHRPGGWNSWYNYYTKVTQKALLAELDALRSAGLALDYVQVDDGWQARTGDWLTLSPGFGDMKALASAIRDAGFEPGIWVAPLVATGKSAPTRQGWVKPWKAGWNPLWRSFIYALDLGRAEARDYVRRVGDAFREWGFGLVKADFLYAAGVRPWGGRTRAQRMREAMHLVREAMPGRLLACGVPLASAVGLCDFARLGPDTALNWEDRLLAFCRYRERPSNLGALRTILGRWFMNGTLFVLDPDVFIFGKGRLTDTERYTLYEVMTTVGGMQSFSDSLGRLAPKARELVKRAFPLPRTAVRSVGEESPDLYAVGVRLENQSYVLRVNLTNRMQRGLAAHSTSREPAAARD